MEILVPENALVALCVKVKETMGIEKYERFTEWDTTQLRAWLEASQKIDSEAFAVALSKFHKVIKIK